MKKLILSVTFSCILSAVMSQDIANIMRAGAEDGQRYINNYIGPGMISFNNGLASGWYNTAETHKLLGIDLTVAVNFAGIPSQDQSFLFRNSDFEVMELQADNSPGASEILPTIAGGSTNVGLRIPANAQVAGLTYNEEINFEAASGAGSLPFDALPTPTLTLGIGLVKNTDLRIRYMPSINTEDFSFELWGVGIMHDLKQWIPGLKLVPIHVSGFVGTTQLNSELAISTDDLNEQDFSVENGVAKMSVNSTTVQVVVSKKLSVFTPYAGVGYNITKSTIDVLGEYTYSNSNPLDPETATVKDPISLEFTEGNSPRFTVGGRLKLLVFTFHADYTFQKYSTFSAGMGISIR